ncbi:hypothetical protein FACS189425_06760 [Clostridia bacterium]|nr:hypothetical protein FACS189425_06760 [Clostridia bacterium]
MTPEIARQHLDQWLTAESKIAGGQSYTIGSRTLTRASLDAVRRQIEYWANKLAELENAARGRGRNRLYRAVPRDL